MHPGLGDPLKHLDALLDALRAERRESRATPCVVIDEIDLLFEGGEGDQGVPDAERFMDALVAEVDAHLLTVLVIGRDARRFHQSTRRDGIANPWAGRVCTRWLRALDRDESRGLFGQLGRRAGITVNDESVDRAYELAGGHPLLLRLYGRALFECMRGGVHADWEALTTAVEERFLEMPETVGLVGDALGLLGAYFPEAWRAIAPAMLAGQDPTPAQMTPEAREGLRCMALVDDDGRIPEALVTLAPLTAPSVERAA